MRIPYREPREPMMDIMWLGKMWDFGVSAAAGAGARRFGAAAAAIELARPSIVGLQKRPFARRLLSKARTTSVGAAIAVH